MSTPNLVISVLLQAVDRLSKPGKGAAKTVSKLGQTVERTQGKLNKMERTAQRGAGFGRMEKAVRRANRALKDQEFRLKVINRLQKKLDANAAKRSKLKSKVLGVAAGAAIAAAPAVTAAQTEEAEIRLSTVLNASDKEAALASARATARQVASTGLVGLIEAFDIQYALNSSGLDARVAASASSVVAKVAKITSGTPEQVGEVIAGTYNNLAENMTGTTEEKLKRIGELLTKTQFKFQIRDFGQLGEGLSFSAASAASAKIPIEQLVTVIGTLNSAQVTGSRAGTAFAAVERNLSKAAKEYGFDIVRMADGQMDFIGTLQELEDSLSIYDDLDEKNAAIQKTFGDEGKVGLVPLLAKLKDLRAAQEDVVEGSRNLVDESAKTFTDGSLGQWNRFIKVINLTADSFGKALLPAVNAVLEPASAILLTVANLAEQFPDTTAAIGVTIAGLAVLRAALLAGRFASLLFSAGLIGGKMSLLGMAATAMKFAGTAIPAVLTGIRAVGLALATTPIGLAVTALSIAAGLVIANWDKVRGFFLKIWEPIRPYWEKFADWVARIWDKISAPFEFISKIFGGGDGPGISEKISQIVEPAKKAAGAVVVGSAIAASPASASPGSAQPPASVSIVVNPAPGQSPEEIAQEVARLLERQQRANVHD